MEPADRAGDERVRLVELHRERVMLRRVSRGIKLALNLPVAAYLGVAIRMEPPAGTAGRGVGPGVGAPPPPLLPPPFPGGRRTRHFARRGGGGGGGPRSPP